MMETIFRSGGMYTKNVHLGLNMFLDSTGGFKEEFSTAPVRTVHHIQPVYYQGSLTCAVSESQLASLYVPMPNSCLLLNWRN